MVTAAKITKGLSIQKPDPDLSIAMAYDFDYSYMSDDQRIAVRQIIASATSGKHTFGGTMPDNWRDYNWMPHGTILILSALAIEGEEGYDPAIYPESVQTMKDYLHYAIGAAGGPNEEMHYFHYGMAIGALAMATMARHGDNLFSDPHYRALPNWQIASMEPYGDAFSMHQDTPNDTGGLAANYSVMKWAWPDNPVLDMVWKNLVEINYERLGYDGNWYPAAAFPSDVKGWGLYKEPKGFVSPLTKWGINEVIRPADYPNPVEGIEKLNLPLSYWEPFRGFLITRDKWGPDGMVLHFDINAQALGGHSHSNSTMFTFSALERKWAIDRGFHIAESKDNSNILIDGKGQGFFPVGGRTVEYREDGDVTMIAGDASEPYHWMLWANNHIGAPYLQGYTFQPMKRPDMVAKFAQIAKNDPQEPWNDRTANGLYPYLAEYNPVAKAFRTALLRRNGAHPYAMIIDDIKKDDQSHTYDWLMQVPDDLEVKGNQEGKMVLGSADPKDNRRLLVQMVSVNGQGQWQLENYEVQRSPITADNTDFGKGKRLKYELVGTEPEFKVLLYPFRDGDALPDAGLGSDTLHVSWPDQKDRYTLSTSSQGRSQIVLQKGA